MDEHVGLRIEPICKLSDECQGTLTILGTQTWSWVGRRNPGGTRSLRNPKRAWRAINRGE
jgi:hypothetical protein